MVRFLGGLAYVKIQARGDLVEVLTLQDLFDPFQEEVVGRYQQGEEVQDLGKLKKAELIFPSGEALPQCWTDPHYRNN